MVKEAKLPELKMKLEAVLEKNEARDRQEDSDDPEQDF